MPKFPTISGEEAVKVLNKPVRQRGSHVVMRKFQIKGDVGCVIPLHKELKIGTLKGILKQTRISKEQFYTAL